MRKIIPAIIGVQGMAIILAFLQALGGVRTDEAKYLLNIPYPHPPLLRWIMSLTEGFVYQEMLWRILLATVFLQAVWLLWDIGRDLPRSTRITLASTWLLSVAVLTQSGTIMLAPVNAIQALVFLWLLSRPSIAKAYPIIIGLFWLASLFTAYQAVLFLPLVIAVYQKSGFRWIDTALYVFGPLCVLTLYTLANPLAMASLVHHGGEDLHSSLLYRFTETGRLWLIAGSGLTSIAGTIGIFLSRKWWLMGSFALIAIFIILNRFPYYALLFTPLLVMGVLELLERRWISPIPFLVLLGVCAFLVLPQAPVSAFMRPTRRVMQAILSRGVEGTILIDGSFGHDWQYESTLPIRRYQKDLLPHAAAVICTSLCNKRVDEANWMPLRGLGLQVWVRR